MTLNSGIRAFFIIILIVVSQFITGCEDDDEPKTCIDPPSPCRGSPDPDGTINISLTKRAGVVITLNIYNSDIDPDNPPPPFKTVITTDSSYTDTLPLGDYSATADYLIGVNTLTAIDGDSISDTAGTYCGPTTCYTRQSAELDLQVDEDAFNQFLSGKDSKCFIATAAYGSMFSEEVAVLRDFRDDYLLKSGAGRLFTRLYYEYSPPIADFISERDYLRSMVRSVLTPLVFAILYPWYTMFAFIFILLSAVLIIRYRSEFHG